MEAGSIAKAQTCPYWSSCSIQSEGRGRVSYRRKQQRSKIKIVSAGLETRRKDRGCTARIRIRVFRRGPCWDSVVGMLVLAREREAKVKVIAVANQKGGVGKTTVTRELSACCALRGYQTLVIDCDPQANLSASWVDPDIYRSLCSLPVSFDSAERLYLQCCPGIPDQPCPLCV